MKHRIQGGLAVLALLLAGCGSSGAATSSTQPVAAVVDKSTDYLRCQKIASDWGEYQANALDPLVAIGQASTTAGNFTAIVADTKTVNDSIEKWSSGMKSSSVESAWTSALGYGRRAAIVFAGSDVNASIRALTGFASAANAAFDICPKS